MLHRALHTAGCRGRSCRSYAACRSTGGPCRAGEAAPVRRVTFGEVAAFRECEGTQVLASPADALHCECTDQHLPGVGPALSDVRPEHPALAARRHVTECPSLARERCSKT